MKGREFPSEASISVDPHTGLTIRQITSHASIHHHPFYYVPAYNDAMRRLYFVSHRSGAAQLFFEDRDTGRLVQMTDRPDLNEWSFHPSHDGRFVYFTAGDGLWRIDSASLVETKLAEIGDVNFRRKGMVGAGMGTTSLSRDDRWWAVPVHVGRSSKLLVVDCDSLAVTTILERDTICHPQFHPDDASLLHYGGSHRDRLWVIYRDGTDNRLVYRRDAAQKEWIVHETWIPGRSELLVTNWPHRLMRVDIHSGEAQTIAKFNAWHPMVNRDGTLVVTDTTCPDVGLHLVALDHCESQPRFLCFSCATNAGTHWANDHCPYDDGPVEVYAPQHTHPHPNFAPDSSRVIFTSDRTGCAQLYEVPVLL